MGYGWKQRLAAHVSLARLDHSIKNVFVIPGIVIPISLAHSRPSALWHNLVLGFLSTTFIACSNYVINETLDAPFDRLHPFKKGRPAALGLVSVPTAYVQWIVMMIIGVVMAIEISAQFTIVAVLLWVMGCVYNIRPVRTKDVVYLDVLSESVNNPLRMLLGWYIVSSQLVPPISLLCCYWMLGCYFMGLKRFSELRELGGRDVASCYRESFKHYTERSLLQSVVFYCSSSMLLFGAFIIRYRMELILSFPIVAWVMCTYFQMAFTAGSAVQNPEKLYREPRLMVELGIAVATITVLLFVDIPWLAVIFATSTATHAIR
jgi:decaprenyl-phosphate phosphoribosyltransferase